MVSFNNVKQNRKIAMSVMTTLSKLLDAKFVYVTVTFPLQLNSTCSANVIK
jgi:hypothetical protein